LGRLPKAVLRKRPPREKVPLANWGLQTGIFTKHVLAKNTGF
jgi:hypothetical protein